MNELLKRVTPNKALVMAMDAVAVGMCDMMQKKGEEAIKLDDLMDMFAHVTKWVAVRHKIEPEGEGNGSGLNKYQSAVKGKDADGGRNARAATAATRITAGATVDQTGSGLAALKRTLPDSSAGSDDGDDGDDSEPAGGEDDPIAINAGGRSVGIPGDERPRPNPPVGMRGV